MGAMKKLATEYAASGNALTGFPKSDRKTWRRLLGDRADQATEANVDDVERIREKAAIGTTEPLPLSRQEKLAVASKLGSPPPARVGPTDHERRAIGMMAIASGKPPQKFAVCYRPDVGIWYDWADPTTGKVGQCLLSEDGTWKQAPTGQQPVILSYRK